MHSASLRRHRAMVLGIRSGSGVLVSSINFVGIPAYVLLHVAAYVLYKLSKYKNYQQKNVVHYIFCIFSHSMCSTLCVWPRRFMSGQSLAV